MTEPTVPGRAHGRALPREHLPRADDFLLWSPALQVWGYRQVDRLFATRAIACGDHVHTWPRGQELAPVIVRPDGREADVAAFMDVNQVAGLLVLHRGEVVLERYGLGLRESDRWSTMSTVKSMTAMLVGAACLDGALGSLDDGVQRHLPQLAGTAYDGVSIRHLLTMSSGVAWSEDYGDRASDVNRYSRALAQRMPGAVLAMLSCLPRRHTPGTVWNYNTGDTYLLGAVLAAALGESLATYMARKVWQPAGMAHEGYYTLDAEGGLEIGGSRAGMTLRDMGRFAQFVLDDGVISGQRVLPAGWVSDCARPAFPLPAGAQAAHRQALGLSSYGYSWWLRDDQCMVAMGHCGQRIVLDVAAQLAIIQLAVYPEPAYVSPGDPNRDAELAAWVLAVRRTLGLPTGSWEGRSPGSPPQPKPPPPH